MQRHLRARLVLIGMVMVAPGWATDIPVSAAKLSIVRKDLDGNNGRRVKVQFAARDRSVTKGAGVDPDQIGVTFDVEYENWNGKGRWVAPAGSSGWLANDASRAKLYVPREAFGDLGKLLIKEGKALKLTSWSYGSGGSLFIDPDYAGDPRGPVYTAYCVTNGGEEHCHCTKFSTCTRSGFSYSQRSQWRLRCRRGVGDPTCRAKCYNVVDRGATMLDGCSGLEWEKKSALSDETPDAGNPHDVDNQYAWAGRCSLDAGVLCQPTPAAAALCAAHAPGASGCVECGPGQGACQMQGPAITTAWDWVAGLNAEGFAGYADWRLPTGASGTGHELASLADHLCGHAWCPNAALGPLGGYHLSSTSSGDQMSRTSISEYGIFAAGFLSKTSAMVARAVRSSP